MPAGTLKNERILCRNIVEISTRQETVFIGEIVLIPAHAVEYCAGSRLMLGNVFTGDALHIGNAGCILQTNVSECNARVEQMLVRIIEAGNNQTTAGVVDLSVSRRLSRNRFIRSDGADNAVNAEERLFKVAAVDIDAGVADEYRRHKVKSPNAETVAGLFEERVLPSFGKDRLIAKHY